MKNNFKLVLISFFVSVVMIVFALNTPATWFSIQRYLPQKLGSTITTISSSDLLSNFPTSYNATIQSLNATKAEISDVSGTTTLSSLSSVGTITTGTWNATRISVPYGGTGWASIASGTIMYGKGSGAIGTTTAGSNGQVLTLVGGTPNWQSGGVDAGLDYTWTGFHNFSYGLFATRASSTNATTTNLTVTGNAIFSGSGTTTFTGGITAAYITQAAATTSANFTLPTTYGDSVTGNAYCASPKIVTGGGYSGLPGAKDTSGNVAFHLVRDSYPTSNGWQVLVTCTGRSTGSCDPGNLVVYAICSRP